MAGIGEVIDELLTLSDEKCDAMQTRRHEYEQRQEANRRGSALQDLASDCGPRIFSTIEKYKIYDDAQRGPVEALRQYINDLEQMREAGRGIFLIGKPGTGKDHLAVSVAREFVTQLGGQSRWLDCADFRSTLRDAIKAGRPTEEELLRPWIAADCLILSDPCPPSATLTDFQAEALFRLVDSRYRAKRCTFVTANFQPGEADKLLGSQVVDRLSHGALRLECGWPSYRMRSTGEAGQS